MSELKKRKKYKLEGRGKRYTVHEDAEEDSRSHSEEDENFQFKDQAELEKITEDGFDKDYESGMWEDPDGAPSAEAAGVPADYDSADYEDKRAEEDTGSVAVSGSVENSEEPSSDYQDSVEPASGSYERFRGRMSVGSMTGERMLLDEDGFPIFDNKYDDFELRRWTKRDTVLAEGPGHDVDYRGYTEDEETTSPPRPVLTTSATTSITPGVETTTASQQTTTASTVGPTDKGERQS